MSSHFDGDFSSSSDDDSEQWAHATRRELDVSTSTHRNPCRRCCRCCCCLRRPLQCLAYTAHVVDLLLGLALSIYGFFVLVKCLLPSGNNEGIPIPTAAVVASLLFGMSMLVSSLCPLDSTSRLGVRCLHLSTCLSPLIVAGEISALVILLVRRQEVLDFLTVHGKALGHVATALVRWLNDRTSAVYSVLVVLGALELFRFILLLRISRRHRHHYYDQNYYDEAEEIERERRTPLLSGWRRRRRRRSGRSSLVSGSSYVGTDDEGGTMDPLDAVEVTFEERHRLVGRSLQDFVPGETTADDGGGGGSGRGGGGGMFPGRMLGFRFWDSARSSKNGGKGEGGNGLNDDDAASSVGFAPVDQDLKDVGLAGSNWWSLNEGGGGENEGKRKVSTSSDDGRGFV